MRRTSAGSPQSSFSSNLPLRKYHLRTVTWKFRDSSEMLPREVPKKNVQVLSPEDLFRGFRFLFENEVRERFVVFWLNTDNRVIGFEIVSEGILDSCVAHPREIFRGAIVATCGRIMLAHNHPSGNLKPSSDDVALTRQLVDSGRILGIPVLDHIIFGQDEFLSFARERLI
jgi:DNA repair protein RadC